MRSNCGPIQVAQGKAAALGQAGAKPSASYNLAGWRSLRKGAGAECQPEHLGAKLDVTAAYSPLESALPSDSPAQTAPAIATANFAGDIVDGWTLELWLKPVPIPAGDTEDRVLVVLVASNPDSSSSNDLQLDCGKALDQVRAAAATLLVCPGHRHIRVPFNQPAACPDMSLRRCPSC